MKVHISEVGHLRAKESEQDNLARFLKAIKNPWFVSGIHWLNDGQGIKWEKVHEKKETKETTKDKNP